MNPQQEMMSKILGLPDKMLAWRNVYCVSHFLQRFSVVSGPNVKTRYFKGRRSVIPLKAPDESICADCAKSRAQSSGDRHGRV